MSDFIRIKAENGSEVSVPAHYEAAFGVKPLDKPATDRFGRPLPTKLRSDLGRSAESPAEAPAEAPARKGSVSKEKQ